MRKNTKYLKRAIALVCVAVMALSVTACGSESTGDATGGQGNTSGATNTVGIAQDNGYAGPTYELTKDIYGLVKSEVNGLKYEYSDHVYDDKHQLVKVTREQWGGDDIIFTYGYDDQGRVVVIKEDYSLEDGGYLETLITYNSKGQKETEVFTSDVSEKNGDTYTYTYEYDEQGRPIFMTCTSTLTDYVKTEKYTYNEKGKIDRIDVVEPDWSYIISGYMYDENDNCIFDNTYSAETGEAIYWNSYEYDDVDSYKVPSTDYEQLNTSDQWLYFEEQPWFPTPDSVNKNITYDSTRNNNGHNIYRFFLSTDNDTARADRYLYTDIIEDVCGCDIYDEINHIQISNGDDGFAAITDTKVFIYWAATEEGRVYFDICFPTEEADEYDILGMERPSHDDDDDYLESAPYDEGSDWENYDYDGDGEINGQEFQDGFNAAVEDMLNQME